MDRVAGVLNSFLTVLYREYNTQIYLDRNLEMEFGEFLRNTLVDDSARNRVNSLSLQPLPGQIRTITIEYPISLDDFPPVAVNYTLDRPIIIKDIIESVFAFYKTRLNLDNVRAYLFSDLDAYSRLNDIRDPILADVLGIHNGINGFSPTATGVRLHIS